MTRTLEKRLTALEARFSIASGTGGTVYVDTRDMTAAAATLAIEQAHEQVGALGCVIILQNTDRLPLPENATVMARVQPDYWDML